MDMDTAHDAALEQTARMAMSLLRNSEQMARRRWERMDDADLSREVQALRTTICGLAQQLAELGDADALAVSGPAAAASKQDSEEQRAARRDNGSGDARGHAPPDERPGVHILAGEDGAAGAGTDSGARDAATDAAGAAKPPPAPEPLNPSEWQVPPHCIPVHANVTTFDWASLYEHTSFDVVLMDPPWQLATANPTRGVALGYSQLTEADICALPVPRLQAAGGFLFVWVINAKYKFTLDLFDKWGYRLVDEVVWVKMTVNRRLAKSHGYYLQHAKEVCLVGVRGETPTAAAAIGDGCGVGSDVIFSARRGQSQKPEELYELIEQLVPSGRYLEIFARKNNLRNFWVSVGNEVTGTGLPEDDVAALAAGRAVPPGAVFGRRNGGGGGGGGSGGA